MFNSHLNDQQRLRSRATLQQLQTALSELTKIRSALKIAPPSLDFLALLKQRAILGYRSGGNFRDVDFVVLPADVEEANQLLAQIDAVASDLVELSRGLSGADTARISADQRPEQAYFKNVTLVLEARPIPGGYLEVCRSVPVVRPSAQTAIFNFITIAKLDDLLSRENHGFGYHYHYCDKKKRRSDTILCFDAKNPPSGSELRWQLHGERNAEFKARAHRWKDKKRCRVYAACEPDLKRWNSVDFLRPERSAEKVWPWSP